MTELSKELIVKFLIKRNILPIPSILEQIKQIKTVDELEEFVKKNRNVENGVDNSDLTIKEGRVEVISSYEEHVKKREISDFITHYNNRFKTLSTILRSRDLDNLTSIRRLADMKNEDVSIIGMIWEKGETKNGHIMLELEDRTGKIKVLISKNKSDLFEIGRNLVFDEVIAVSGRMNKDGDLLFANDLIYPDIPMGKILKKSQEEGSVVFTSDLHIGSKYFYAKEFESFINWINSNKKVKYLVIAGDVVEGVGIFPGQEKEVSCATLTEQFTLLKLYLEKISKKIKIIICPGNHDGVRLAEPQPPFNPKYIKEIKDMPNVILVSSPSIVNIDKTENFEGFNILLYHGFSLPYYGDKVPEIREQGGLEKTDLVMKYFLQRRHLAPSHGSTQFIPDIRKDFLLIEKVPDFFVTGHVHKIIIGEYRGVTLLNTSAWVKETEYQSRFGLKPDNCRAIIIDLKTRDLKILNFLKEENSNSTNQEEIKIE